MEGPREAGDGEESPPDTAPPAPLRKKWVPNDDLVNVLLEMGISRNAAIKGLFHTGNKSADLAALWVFSNQDSANLDAPLSDDAEAPEHDDLFAEDEAGPTFKMVFVVNTELQMGVGKIAAQVAHSALALYRCLSQNEEKHGTMLFHWLEFGETKIVLQGDNTQHLEELERKAALHDLPTFLVQDAGRTQIPEGSKTVLSIMGKSKDVDKVTGTLKLL